MTDQDTYPEPRNNRRPRIITFLALVVFGHALFHLFSFIQILTHWNLLADLSLSLESVFIAVYNLVWTGAGVLISLSLWTGKGWARPGCLSYWILYSIWSWIRLIWIVEPTILQSRWPVNLVLTLLGLGSLVAILNLKSTRSYFGKNGVKIP